MTIVVIGGTGLIGSKLVKKLNELGHACVAASPSTGVNTLKRKYTRSSIQESTSWFDQF